MGLKADLADPAMDVNRIRDAMLEAHAPLIEQAARQGAQVLCFQEVFTQPYFCPSRMRNGTRPPNPSPAATRRP